LIRLPFFGYNMGNPECIEGFYVYDRQRLYLRLGDRVIHLNYEEWGEGVVVEEMTSVLVGGTCLIRIQFEDGQQRTFNNDLDNELCCYYFGVRRCRHPLWNAERVRPPRPTKRVTRK
jgi:hypothetical protein